MASGRIHRLGMLALGRGGGCACKADWDTIEHLTGHPLFAASRAHQLGLHDAASSFTSNGETLVCSVDLIGPVSRGARDFGAVAAAHSLSDLFAVGAKPSFALALAAWPPEGDALLPDALQGVYDGLLEAGVQIIGGHTARSDQPLLGISVFGFRKETEDVKPRIGDAIYLTKSIGTGVAIGAIQEEVCPVALEESTLRSMLSLNSIGLELNQHPAVRLVSDVTGFGLAGQAIRLARRCGHSIVIDGSKIPSFPGVRSLIKDGMGSTAAEINLSLVKNLVAGGDRVSMTLASDPQTNGPLLVVADTSIEQRFAKAGILYRVGEVSQYVTGRPVTIA